MSAGSESSTAPEPREDPVKEPGKETEWQRRRRLAAAFGEGVPEQTSDDRDPGEDKAGKGDDWYREQVPPHHG